MLLYDESLRQYARQLRENMTDAERRLWARLRMKQLNGCQFYRQKPVGDYIVDFYCPKAKLAIEVDGSWHFLGRKIEYDWIRDESLRNYGLRVLRYTNIEVLKSTDAVVESIMENLKSFG